MKKLLLSHDLTGFQSSGIQPAGAGERMVNGRGSAQFPPIRGDPGRGEPVFPLTGLHSEFWKLVSPSRYWF